ELAEAARELGIVLHAWVGSASLLVLPRGGAGVAAQCEQHAEPGVLTRRAAAEVGEHVAEQREILAGLRSGLLLGRDELQLAQRSPRLASGATLHGVAPVAVEALEAVAPRGRQRGLGVLADRHALQQLADADATSLLAQEAEHRLHLGVGEGGALLRG